METSLRTFLDLYRKNYGDKNKTLKELGFTHKEFNFWFYTNQEFGEECNEIEKMRNNQIEDEIYQILYEDFIQLQEDGFEYKDCVRVTGIDPLENDKKISGTTRYQYSKPSNFWDKYKLKLNSNDPEEKINYEIEYRKKLLFLKESRFNKNQLIKDKRKKKLEEFRNKLRVQDPQNKIFKSTDEVIDWEIEKIIKRTEKNIKILEERIKKQKILVLERKKSDELKQFEYSKLLEEKERGKIEKLRDIEIKKIQKSKLNEENRKNREIVKHTIYKSGLERRNELKIERENLKNQLKTEKYLSRLELKTNSTNIKTEGLNLFNKLKVGVLKKTIPVEILNKVKKSNEFGTKLFDINNKIVFQKCSSCDEYKGKDHFHRKGKNDLVSYCIECTRKRMGLDPKGGRRGESYKGKVIKKYNKNGNETHRRCTSCDEFYPTNDFRYKYRTSSVCKNCYVKLPNNHLSKPGEYNSVNIKVRWFDPNSFEVTHKRCNLCEKKKKREDFTMRTKSTDGLSIRCRSCDKEVRDQKK
ncbi:hypothetical protein [Aquirufa antheringensis]